MLKHGILGLLSYGDMTGYEIMTIFKGSLNFFWEAQTSQIYRELSNLKSSGWVTDTLVEQTDKPDKKVYTITDEGKNELSHWLASEDLTLPSRNPMLMQVFFSGRLDSQDNIARFKNLKEQMSFADGSLADAEPAIGNYAKELGNENEALYWAMTLEFGRMYSAMVSEWCDRCISMLEGRE